jgi:hypothetical protein
MPCSSFWSAVAQHCFGLIVFSLFWQRRRDWRRRGLAQAGQRRVAIHHGSIDFLGRKSDTGEKEEREVFTMPDFAGALGASKAASTLLVLFLPSKDRTDKPIDQEYCVGQALRVLGTLFGGATAFPQGKGVWRDDARSGKLLFDEPVVIQC